MVMENLSSLGGLFKVPPEKGGDITQATGNALIQHTHFQFTEEDSKGTLVDFNISHPGNILKLAFKWLNELNNTAVLNICLPE